MKFWAVYEPVLSATIVAAVDPILEWSRPSFLDSIRLSEFTLGSESPVIEAAKIYPNTDSDIIHLDLDLVFSPNDEENMSKSRTNKYQWNSRVVLTTRVGKGVMGVDIPVMLTEVYFKGKVRLGDIF
jgi:Ca2+-dependent lipid-binding protein